MGNLLIFVYQILEFEILNVVVFTIKVIYTKSILLYRAALNKTIHILFQINLVVKFKILMKPWHRLKNSPRAVDETGKKMLKSVF